MTTLADDLQHLRATANATVARRWRRRGAAITVLAMLVLAMLVPTAMQMSGWAPVAWMLSYLAYPDGEVPTDEGASSRSMRADQASVTAWGVVDHATESHLILRIEVSSALDPAPNYVAVARWIAEPMGVLATPSTRAEFADAGWEVASAGGVVGVSDGRVLLAAPMPACASRAALGGTGSFCVLTAAFALPPRAPLPSSILLVDAASGAVSVELVLERNAYRVDACRVAGCGGLTPVA